MVRWQFALGSGAGAAIIGLACGGPAFQLAQVVDDASAIDASDAGADASTDATSDVYDARSVRDAMEAMSGDEPPAHCGGRLACAPVVPPGWIGPFELYAGPTAPPGCDADFSGSMLDGNGGLTAPAATCNCGCGQAQGVQCSVPTLTFYDLVMASCSLMGCANTKLNPGACTTVNACSALPSKAMIFLPSTPSAGSCPPLGTAAVAAYTWATQARGCRTSVAPAQADCANGYVCAPAPTGRFRSGLCIEQPRDVPCPSADYSNRYVYYGSVDDSRKCSDCSCGDAGVTGATCKASVEQFPSTDGGCAGGSITYGPSSSCQAIQQPADLRLTLSASGGSCAASMTGPIGSATPTSPMTFCCLP
jgi:hypothetical protein